MQKKISGTTTIDYLDVFQYRNGVLEFFQTSEGFVKNTVVGGQNTYNYVFQYKDHLGNVRLNFGVNPSTQEVEILGEDNYYPFGLTHSNYNMSKKTYDQQSGGPGSTVPCDYCPGTLYMFNGKELQTELGMYMYDYGARNYDPKIGRWMNIDPLAEIARRWSPYTYANDNPVFFIDPDGMSAVGADGLTSEQWVQASKPQNGGVYGDMANSYRNQNRQDNYKSQSQVSVGELQGETIEPPVNFFKPTSMDPSQKSFNDVFDEYNKEGNYEVGDGIFRVFGHGSGMHIGDRKNGYGSILDAETFDKVMSELSPAYAEKIKNGESFTLYLYSCQSASEFSDEVYSMAKQISLRHPNATIIGFDGYVIYGKRGGHPEITKISTTYTDPTKLDNDGYRVTYKNGVVSSKVQGKDILK